LSAAAVLDDSVAAD